MKSSFDEKANAYNVCITQIDLVQAFQSEEGLNIFLHDIVACTYGEWAAEAIFSII